MKNTIFFIDDHDGFWLANEAFKELINDSAKKDLYEPRPHYTAGSQNELFEKIGSKKTSSNGVCLITDNHFGRDPAGGAKLACEFIKKFGAQCSAVVYSDEPDIPENLLNGLDESQKKQLKSLKKGDGAKDAEKILTFFQTGKWLDFDFLQQLKNKLVPLQMAVEHACGQLKSADNFSCLFKKKDDRLPLLLPFYVSGDESGDHLMFSAENADDLFSQDISELQNTLIKEFKYVKNTLAPYPSLGKSSHYITEDTVVETGSEMGSLRLLWELTRCHGNPGEINTGLNDHERSFPPRVKSWIIYHREMVKKGCARKVGVEVGVHNKFLFLKKLLKDASISLRNTIGMIEGLQ